MGKDPIEFVCLLCFHISAVVLSSWRVKSLSIAKSSADYTLPTVTRQHGTHTPPRPVLTRQIIDSGYEGAWQTSPPNAELASPTWKGRTWDENSKCAAAGPRVFYFPLLRPKSHSGEPNKTERITQLLDDLLGMSHKVKEGKLSI